MNSEMQDFGHRKSDYLRPNQTWQCGGAKACKHGPTAKGACPRTKQPCVPQRSVRSKKSLITLWMVCVSIACIALVLSAPGLLSRIAPGPLSVSHAEVAECQDCHAAAKRSVSAWIRSAVSFNGHNDDQQCLNCHKLGDNAFLAHSTAADNFSQLMRSADGTPSARVTINWQADMASKLRAWQQANSQSPEHEVSCSVCHREHKGELNSRDDFNPQKCHTCHQRKFDAIQDGHPQYTDYPHSKPTRIKFDHALHIGKHFLEEDYSDKAPKGCKQCHTSDQTGEWMVSKNFETSCSSCHLDDVLGSNRATDKGVSVLAIPELDVQSLNAAGFNVGQWPNWADGELTPFMRVLIPSAKQLENLSLFDLSNASSAQLKAAAQLAWDIKTLFYDLQMGGTEVVQKRLSNAFGGSLERSTLNRLIAAFPRDTLVNNQKAWFPNLMDEMARYKRGEFGPYSALETPLKPIESTEALAKPKMEIGEVLGEGDEDILSDDDEILLDDDEDILIDDDEDILTDDEALSDDDDDEVEGVIQLIASDNETWARTGGWYRDGSRILYRPMDHADRFFKTWLDVSAKQRWAADRILFESLSAEKSVGSCTKCHSIESSSQGAPSNESSHKVYWQSFRPSDVKVDFNRFSHVSHFGLLSDEGCVSCHVLSSSDSSQGEAKNQALSLSAFATSGFKNMERDTCTQCHQPSRAPDNCLTCHNYHAESEGRAIDLIEDELQSRTQTGNEQ